LVPDQIELHVSRSQIFSGFTKSFDQAEFVVFGVPFDKTSTYRSGSKFAPAAIREASLNIETYSFRSKFDLEDAPICDIGDLHVVDSVDETMRRLSAVEDEILKASKIPIAIGGEHTISFGAIRSFPRDVGIVCFDAHADMRDEYMGEKLMHATFLRRIIENVGSERIVHVGLRAVCREELSFIEKNHVRHFSMQELKGHDRKEDARNIRRAVSEFEKLYVTIDMDAFDPGFAPGVGNPEPDGMWPDLFFTILTGLCDERVAGLDLVELSPNYDNGVTASLAAKVLFEAICAVESAKGKNMRK
jgi:agmatinase